MITFIDVLDIDALWILVGADLPWNAVNQLVWRARVLMTCHAALDTRIGVLHRLRSQQEIDEGFWWDSHSSCPSRLTADVPSIPSLPSYYGDSD